MTPGARLAAAIDILETIEAGANAERALTVWARANRFAGSKDRAAIRDHVFDTLRQWRSSAWMGGAETARGRIIGLLRLQGIEPGTLLTGEGYAPAALDPAERAAATRKLEAASRTVRLDVPDWQYPLYEAVLGADTAAVLDQARMRAPVFLRVNLARADRAAALAVLARDEIAARPHPLSPTALEVTRNARRIGHSQAFAQGVVELQDAASQALVDMLPLEDGQAVLDYCAGGGGKALAMCARAELRMTAYDVSATRMQDIPARAARAGVQIEIDTDPKGVFDLVLCDAPCSGSGAWRRAPQAKWALTPERLDELTAMQREILDTARQLVAPGGTLAYATCSLFDCENHAQVSRFVTAHPGWTCTAERIISPLEGGDGFYVALMHRS